MNNASAVIAVISNRVSAAAKSGQVLDIELEADRVGRTVPGILSHDEIASEIEHRAIKASVTILTGNRMRTVRTITQDNDRMAAQPK